VREGKRDRGSAAWIEIVGQESIKLNPGVVAMPKFSSANRRVALVGVVAGHKEDST
jgi:hypothetical protein